MGSGGGAGRINGVDGWSVYFLERVLLLARTHKNTHTKGRSVAIPRQQQNPGGVGDGYLSIYDLERPRAGCFQRRQTNNSRRGRRSVARDGEKGAVGPSKRSRPDCSDERRDGGAGGRTLWIGGLGIWGERRSKGKSDKARHAAACLLEGSTKGAGRPGGEGQGGQGLRMVGWVPGRYGNNTLGKSDKTQAWKPGAQHGLILPDPGPPGSKTAQHP